MKKSSDNASKHITKNQILRTIIFAAVVVGFVLKAYVFLGFTMNKDIYSLDFALGRNEGSYFYEFYIAFTLVFLSFYFLFKKKGRFIFLLIMDAFLSFLTAVDLWYYRGFRTVPSLIIVKQTANLDNLSGSVFSMMSPLDFLLFLDVILLLVFAWKIKNIYDSPKRNPGLFALILALSIGFLSYIPFMTNVMKKDVSKSYIYSMYDPNDTSRYFSPIGYHVFNAYQVYRDSKPLELSDSQLDEINEWYDEKQENLPDNEYKGKYKGKNLIYIQVESLESFVIGDTAEGQEITPNLNKLLSQSIYFPNIKEQVNEGTSSDSDLMVNTSMLPLRQGSTFFSYPGNTYNSMPKLLDEMGYSNIAIHPDKGPFWNWMNGLKGVGFDNLIDYYSFNDDEEIGLGLSDRTYLSQIVPKLQDMQQPFYSFMVTLTSHGPFDLPSEYREMNFTGELSTNILGDYFQSVHYTDKQIGMFIEKLDEAGILDNSIVVISGDHTGVHKYYTDKLESLTDAKESWTDVTWNVPLIIYDKSAAEGKTYDTIGGQIDIMPTLAYLMGVDPDKYAYTALGRNLLNTNKSFAVLTDRTVMGDNLTEEDKAHAVKSLEIANMILKSNYFEKYYNK